MCGLLRKDRHDATNCWTTNCSTLVVTMSHTNSMTHLADWPTRSHSPQYAQFMVCRCPEPVNWTGLVSASRASLVPPLILQFFQQPLCSVSFMQIDILKQNTVFFIERHVYKGNSNLGKCVISCSGKIANQSKWEWGLMASYKHMMTRDIACQKLWILFEGYPTV